MQMLALRPQRQLLQAVLLAASPRIPVTAIRQPLSTAHRLYLRHHQTHPNSAQPFQPHHCWRCGANITSPSEIFCGRTAEDIEASRDKGDEGCGAIQPVPPGARYGNVLLPRSVVETKNEKLPFDIDVGALRRRFLRLQQAVHPDGFEQKSETEKELSDQQSSFINKAFQTLRDPLARAKYLLNQVDMKVEESSSLDDPELLMEVLEVREQLEEAQSDEEVAQIGKENEGRMEETISKLSEAFADGDMDRARTLTIHLQYWANIKRAIQEWEPGKRVELKH
ncbi:hypothetical protein HK097_006369 [Rhizophlyctis rosea]|uniref:Co-chaperone HscB C-terminal oligomerisation domain-containing protein n=1 Tax=Rhizophlyctis rosea TaxID=64517 RepID=A0AAD5SLW7_9FUNG|nr:hypothetical protein HK097_006369 [Rhizophlyctis rosea]